MRIAVELDAPTANAKGDGLRSYVESAVRLKAAGADMLTIADNPCAMARGDSVSLSLLFSRAAGIPIMPHIACRDRNLLALKSALLALDIANEREILIVTGDPLRDDEKTSGMVSSGLTALAFAKHIAEWNRESFFAPFSLSAALNVNAPNFDAELRKAQRKIGAGVSRFLSQPVLSRAALENISRARRELGAEIYGGIIPIVSRGNAEFLARGEISGICVDRDVLDAYSGCDRERGSELAVSVSLEFIAGMGGCVDGIYVITPFRRVDIVERIIAAARAEEASPAGERARAI